jgi:5-methylcytosine-specific restriction endonuclease McrA
MPKASRDEFSAKVRDQAAIRAAGRCELCGLPFKGRPEFDHRLPLALGGKSDLPNCQAICRACHAAKTAKEDVPRIRKADRQRKASIGARTAPVRPLVSAPFPVSERTAKREAKPSLPPRKMYEDEK